MPTESINGRSIHFQITGDGPQTVVFSHGFLMSHKMFAAQVEALSKTHRVIVFDHRGHGDSGPCDDPFTLDDLVSDAAALLDALGTGPVHFAGMSTGGFVGLRLLLTRPDLIASLTLIDTSASAEPPEKMKRYNLLLFLVRFVGMRPLLGQVFPLLFGPTFRNDPARSAENAQWKSYIGGLQKGSIRQFGHAIFGRDDICDRLRALAAPPPVLILVGEDDIPTPPTEAEKMQAALKGAQLTRIPQAGHSSPVEQPDAVTQAMVAFLPA